LAERDEIWQRYGSGQSTVVPRIWWTLAYFFYGAQKFLTADIFHTVVVTRRKLAALGVWPIDLFCPNVAKFRRSFANFFPAYGGSKIFWQRISRGALVGARPILAALRVWPIDIYSPNLVYFGPGVPQYHAATCISPSLMHLSFYMLWFLSCGIYATVS